MIQIIPFALGALVGSTAVVLFNRREKLKDDVRSFATCSKERVVSGVKDAKDSLKATLECINEKKENIKKEKEDNEN